ncbi:MAG: 1,4-alpha-glucan branching protein GlgB [Lachnospiraceae bacterium]|nr:1,4-alpha-glucan branching protein GlgB [Lachnospiraceae bacterium]
MRKEYHFSEYDQYLFGHATHYDIYNKLGSHTAVSGDEEGIYFAVWAPHAKYVSVVGDFNGWDTGAAPMTVTGDLGVWECFISNAFVGQKYKYFIVGAKGEELYKADPFANQAELRPGTASVICDISELKWTDDKWMKARQKFDIEKDPMLIYECHIGSWMKHPFFEEGIEGFYTYREFAEAIADYCKEMGYTHVELMGIEEYPFDGSWGYQVTGYFAPTSRYGTAEDFQYMVNYLHEKGIGVIVDWVPAHFPRDAHGLADFDGEPLYEYADSRKGEHKEWGTKVFDYGRLEVKNFLIASALFWIENMHIDGLRVDAVASMLYLDYNRKDGEWIPNEYGGNYNLEAIEFFKHLNSLILGRNKGTVMIAEESTAFPKITGKPEDDGLGFSMKWNMGWMNDFLEYMKLDPFFRKDNHHKMTFSTSYAYSEKYVLVLSHDEVVHLKCSMLEKMPGLMGDKFANLRAGYTFMTGHPGKKLLFMGQEFGQHREWSEARELDWYVLADEQNRSLQHYVRALNRLYRRYPALHGTDYDPRGFEWINADDNYRSIYSFMRKSLDGKNNLLFVINFTPVAYDDFRVGVPVKGRFALVLGTGGPGAAKVLTSKDKLVRMSKKAECDGRPYSIGFPLPAYGAYVFKFDYI